MHHHDDDVSSNLTGHRTFEEVLEKRRSRREILSGGLAAATAFVGAPAVANAGGFGNVLRRDDIGAPAWLKRWVRPLIDFSPVPLAAGNGPWPQISADYDFDVLIPWGEPVIPGGPAYRGEPDRRPTALEQTLQVGIGHDGMWFFPISRKKRHGWWGRDHRWWDDRLGWWGTHHGDEGNSHGLLVLNNEYGTNQHLLGKSAPESLEDVRLSQHAHGVTIVEIRKKGGKWVTVPSNYARRIHANTPMAFSGPAANHALLKTPAGNRSAGTLNNCANGHTPWGTYLTCEENFHGYFGRNGDFTPSDRQRRYGVTGSSGYQWHRFDPRFDLSNPNYTNEDNRFGWVVEIDPFDDREDPVKRTALGRFKHEGAEVVVGRGGRVVVYMGDDQANDYFYKFVSSDNWKSLRARGKSPLDHGTLYVARFDDDGTGVWLPLSVGNPVLAGHFADQAEIVTFARVAADLVGATPMDRPEWATTGPNGEVYLACTNNTGRTVPNGPNPIAPNRHGHIVKVMDRDEHVGTRFDWDVFLIAQDTHGTEESFASPDGLWADPDGRLFIQTDGAQADGLNDQMVVADLRTGAISRLFTGVTGCEITGVAVTPDRRTMFINVQHPGDGNPSQSNFPRQPDGMTIPRDATVVITRKNGGIIGS